MYTKFDDILFFALLCSIVSFIFWPISFKGYLIISILSFILVIIIEEILNAYGAIKMYELNKICPIYSERILNDRKILGFCTQAQTCQRYDEAYCPLKHGSIINGNNSAKILSDKMKEIRLKHNARIDNYDIQK